VGKLCRFSHAQLNLSNQAVRVIKIQPAKDHETANLALQWHEDQWYTDTYGQSGVPIYAGNNKTPLSRPPFPWQPFDTAGLVGDPIYDPSDFTFGMTQVYDKAQDGSALVEIRITGSLPVNSFATLQAPLLALQGTVATGNAAYLAPGQVLYAVVAPVKSGTPGTVPLLDPAATMAPAQIYPCTIAIPSGGANNNEVTVPVAAWPSGADGWALFAGNNPAFMSLQLTGLGNPSSITLSGNPEEVALQPADSLNVRTLGPPDVNFDHLVIRIKKQIHGGVWGQQVDVVTPTTLQFIGALWDTNQWAGYDVSVTYSYPQTNAAVEPQARLTFRVASNTADTLKIEFMGPADGPSDLTQYVNVGDVFVMRTKPNIFSATTIGDTNFVHNTTPGQPETTKGLVPNEGNYVLRIYAGTGAGQWRNAISNTKDTYTVDQPFNPIPDATSRFWIEESMWQPGVESSQITNTSLTGAIFSGVIPVPNYAGESVVIQAMTADANGNLCFEQYAPIRDYYVAGQPGITSTAVAFTFTGTGGQPANLVVGALSKVASIPDGAGRKLRGWTIDVDTPSTGNDVIGDIVNLTTGLSLWANEPSLPTVPAGQTGPITGFFTTDVEIADGDRLRATIIQTGSAAAPGQNLGLSIW
jgi:hypothetical protein